MNSNDILPLGKLPPELLAALLQGAPTDDASIVLGPGVGLDCAVIEVGDRLLVYKSEPITFVTENIGWYGVQVSANDIATTGARPRWYLATLLLPEGKTTPALAQRIGAQLCESCRQMGVALIGGHTEITHGLDRPVLCGTMIGEVTRQQLVTPRGVQPGDSLLLTKGVPVEGAAILAGEFAGRLQSWLSAAELEEARQYLYRPGIGVLRDAQVACAAGRVHAMHDPTEGGLAGALWELAEASGCALRVTPAAVPVPELAQRICRALSIDPLATIASGALLLSAAPADVPAIQAAMQAAEIPCAVIGRAEAGAWGVWTPDGRPLPRPERDEIARLYEQQ